MTGCEDRVGETFRKLARSMEEIEVHQLTACPVLGGKGVGPEALPWLPIYLPGSARAGDSPRHKDPLGKSNCPELEEACPAFPRH